jgi:glucose-6-phosphate isomerase
MDMTPTLQFRASYTFAPLKEDTLDMMMSRYDRGLLGFLDLPGDAGLLESALALAADFSVRAEQMLVAGIGGSSLGLRALLCALKPASARSIRGTRGMHGIHVVDSPDEILIEQLTQGLDPSRTAVTVVTKSGGTAETLAIFMRLYDWLPEDARNGLVIAITDPAKGDLRRLSEALGWATLPVPSGVGGRFSVLSPVGIFPAAFMGIDVISLLRGAALVVSDFFNRGRESLAALVASAFLSRFRTHPVHVFMPYTDLLRDTSLWFSQLWAESLSKAMDLDGNQVNTGQVPLACRGPADQHSLLQLLMEGPADKAITLVTTPGSAKSVISGRVNPFEDYPSMSYLYGRSADSLRNAEAEATGKALVERGLPVDFLIMPSVSAAPLGELLMVLEIATVLTGLALNIDPMDQPGVERSKILTYEAMGRPGY